MVIVELNDDWSLQEECMYTCVVYLCSARRHMTYIDYRVVACSPLETFAFHIKVTFLFVLPRIITHKRIKPSV